MLISFLVPPQCADRRADAKAYGNAQHHAKTDIIDEDSNEDAEAQSHGKTDAAVAGLNRYFFEGSLWSFFPFSIGFVLPICFLAAK